MSEKRPRGYFDQSRDLTNALILIAPVLVLYQVGLLLTGFQGLNGFDFATILVVHYGSWQGLLAFNAAILIGISVAAYVRRNNRSLGPELVPLVLLESAVYALSLGSVIGFVLRRIPALGPPGGMSPLHGCVASLGAGVNEELFFRLFLLQAIAWALSDAKGEAKPGALAFAVAVSSALFSAAHHLGSEPFEIHAFVYRLLAGMIFAGLFLGRGLAVAVYTHALYDILVLVIFPLLRGD